MATFDTSMYRGNPLKSMLDYENDYLRADTQRSMLQRNKLAMENDAQDQRIKQAELEMKLRAEPDVRAKQQADMSRGNVEAAAKAATFMTSAIAQATGPDQVAELMAGFAQNPDLAPAFTLIQGGYDGALQRLRENSGTPEAFAKYQLQVQKGIEALLPKIQSFSTGTAQNVVAFDPQTAKPLATNSYPIEQSENSKATERVAGVRNEIAAAKAEAAPTIAADKDEEKRAADIDRKVTRYSETLQKHGIPEFEDSLANLEGVFAEYDKGKVPGVGKAVGMLPAWMQGQEAERVNQAIAEVKNVLLKARSGAAVTDSELRRFVEELGTGGLRSEETVRLAVERIRKRFNDVKANAAAGVSDEVKNTYEERGGVVINRGVDKKPVAPEKPMEMPAMSDIDAEIARRQKARGG